MKVYDSCQGGSEPDPAREAEHSQNESRDGRTKRVGLVAFNQTPAEPSTHRRPPSIAERRFSDFKNGFWNKFADKHLQRAISQPIILIGVMGVTGTGKSNFISTVSNDDKILVGNNLLSCTKKVKLSIPFRVGRRMVQLVDTPGFSDDKMSDSEVLLSIFKWMATLRTAKKALHGFLFFHRITDARMDGGAIRALKLFEDICGGNFLQNSAVITTMWDKYPNSHNEHIKREQELMNEYWHNCLNVRLGQKDARLVDELASGEEINLGPGSGKTHPGVVGGAMYMRSDNRKSTFERIIRRIIKRDPGIPQLQRELEEHLSLHETTAGKGLNEGLIQAQKKKNDLRRISRIGYSKEMVGGVGEVLPPREIGAEMGLNHPPKGMQTSIEGTKDPHTASEPTRRAPDTPILPKVLGEESSLDETPVEKEPSITTPAHDINQAQTKHMDDNQPSEIMHPGEELLPPSKTAAGSRLKRQPKSIENFVKAKKNLHTGSHVVQTANSNGERKTGTEGGETRVQTAEAEPNREHSGPAAEIQIDSTLVQEFEEATVEEEANGSLTMETKSIDGVNT